MKIGRVFINLFYSVVTFVGIFLIYACAYSYAVYYYTGDEDLGHAAINESVRGLGWLIFSFPALMCIWNPHLGFLKKFKIWFIASTVGLIVSFGLKWAAILLVKNPFTLLAIGLLSVLVGLGLAWGLTKRGLRRDNKLGNNLVAEKIGSESLVSKFPRLALGILVSMLTIGVALGLWVKLGHNKNEDLTEEIDTSDITTGRIRIHDFGKPPGPTRPGGIIIEGPIQDGDYDKFVKLVKVAGKRYSSVFPFSRGGNAIEAMKIGTLIRDLNYKTWVWPMDVRGKRKCFFESVAQENCTCESACFLIFIGGVDRSANILGIHRVYLDHNRLKSLNGATAISVAEGIKGKVGSYLKTMGTPDKFIEKMFSVPSNEMYYLNETERNELSGNIEAVDEWIAAKCPYQSIGEARKWLENVNPKVLIGASDKLIRELGQASCQNKAKEDLIDEGWAKVFGEQN